MHARRTLAGLMVGGALCAISLSAGVANPDLSALGQVRAGIADDPDSPDDGRPTLALGEAEIFLSAPLNPYLSGFFTFAAGEEGVGMEEAYASILRGLRFGLGLKAGQYRLGFGKLNHVHPHAYPFLDAPRNWTTLLTGGEEGWNDVGVQASLLLPTPGEWASIVSADVLRGASFHPGEEETRLGWLGRWSNTFMLGEKAALEAGVSGATGLDAVAADARGWLAGGDLKVKLYLSPSSSLVLQGEGAWRRGHVVDTGGGALEEDRSGLYAFVDWRISARWNVGGLFDQAERAGDPGLVDRSVKAFAGFAVMEESTLLRLAYEAFLPDGEDLRHAVALQFLFSMGPHKPHQF